MENPAIFFHRALNDFVKQTRPAWRMQAMAAERPGIHGEFKQVGVQNEDMGESVERVSCGVLAAPNDFLSGIVLGNTFRIWSPQMAISALPGYASELGERFGSSWSRIQWRRYVRRFLV